jgi:hypothetical protein
MPLLTELEMIWVRDYKDVAPDGAFRLEVFMRITAQNVAAEKLLPLSSRHEIFASVDRILNKL